MSNLPAVVLAAMFLFLSALAPQPAAAALGDCSQPVTNGTNPTASDCLFILRSAVGSETCTPVCVCDPSGAGGVTASDALVCLKKAVGQDVALACPAPCGGGTTTSSTTTSSTTTSTSSTTTNTETTTTTVGGGQPQLTAGDFPSVSPCANRDTLPNDAEFIATVEALDRVNVIVNFTQYNAQGMPEICGLGDADNELGLNDVEWDPSRTNSFGVCSPLSATVADYFANVTLGHGPDMCRTNTDLAQLAMPRAGVYRKDSCVESGGDAYDVRTRVTVSGPSVDKTFTELGITRGDLKACDGTTEIATQAQAKALLTGTPTDIDFNIKSGSCNGGTEHLTVAASIICVDKRTAACPAPMFGSCN
jgi:hypothetical protein